MQEQILQAIFDNTNETKKAVDNLHDSIVKIETITTQNQKDIEVLNQIVWKSVGNSVPLSKAYAEQSEQIKSLADIIDHINYNLTKSIQKVESDLKEDVNQLNKSISDRSSFTNTALLTIFIAFLSGFVGFAGSLMIEHYKLQKPEIEKKSELKTTNTNQLVIFRE
jgi:septal ring factor EnvC (AmiA/AmiB activator)